MIKIWLSCLVFVLAVGSAAGNGGSEDGTESEEIVIGMTVPGMQFPFYVIMGDEAQMKADELGVKLIIHDSQNQSSNQVSAIENFAAQQVDGILVTPMTSESQVPAIEAALNAGIPVATVDRKANTDKVLVHVGADNVEGGRAAARYIIEQLGGEGNVIQLEGTPGASPAIDRRSGFDEVIAESRVKILVSQTAEFTRAQGQRVMENLMQAYPDFDGIFAANDEMIIGAIEAMTLAGIDPASKVTVGFDATPDAFTYIEDGTLDATIDQFPGDQAREALQILYDYITAGKTPENDTIFISPLPVP